MNDLIFRDQNESLASRASAHSEASTSTTASASNSQSRQPSPVRDKAATAYFFQHFITPGHLSFLEGTSPDEVLLKTILACGMAGRANRDGDLRGREVARRYYVEAIAATNAALRHPKRVKEDTTLTSVYLLGLFEHTHLLNHGSSTFKALRNFYNCAATTRYVRRLEPLCSEIFEQAL
ncbi:hypothetical protein LTR36_010361 [Oleoguttula mirabilis]|uniref:Uncharacterized protein n=1 Tax=Oleoguttula mirabilis TaxID=1507867 RepID=A0AAV9J4B8_9PEZI|nr:hypothetical protein LTR36_010361 [Oleoguttula mirabilis]